MGKEKRVTCDFCGIDGFGKKYFTLNIRKAIHGKQTLNPVIYLCPKCFREIKLALLLFDTNDSKEEPQ